MSICEILIQIYYNIQKEKAYTIKLNRERSDYMPTSDNGLKLVNSFIEETGIEKMSLAAKYGVAKNVMIDILSGRLQSPKAHQVILKIIDDFKLR